jgi:DNA-binding transcriptional regulator GbsR (MarR family)
MGVMWGINRSMALGMSRGNASMSLKDLRNWGVVRKVNLTGERRDFYIAEEDPWSMLFRIASERKKREFDPALTALQRALATTDEEDDLVKERLEDLEEMLRAMDRLLQRFLASEGASRGMLKFLSAQIPYRSKKDE